MAIYFNSYSDMVNFPIPINGTIGVIKSLAKSYTFDATEGKWISSNDDKVLIKTLTAPDGITKFSPAINSGEYSKLENIHSSIAALIISLAELPDANFAYTYTARFATPATMGITTFKAVGPGFIRVAVAHDLTSRVIKFSAAQLNHIYATLADQTIVTATESISYVTATSTLSVGTETLVLDGSATEDVYFVCSSTFGVVTAVGTEFDLPTLYDNVTWIGTAPSLEAGKTYEISVLNGLAVISGSV